MLHFLNPLLDDEERRLLETAPESCFQRMVSRGALSLDDVISHLPPHVAEVLRGIAAGERVAEGAPPQEPSGPPTDAELESGLEYRDDLQGLPREQARAYLQGENEQARVWLEGSYPTLLRLLDQGGLTPNEAVQAAQAMDSALGRYLTGTRYAAP